MLWSPYFVLIRLQSEQSLRWSVNIFRHSRFYLIPYPAQESPAVPFQGPFCHVPNPMAHPLLLSVCQFRDFPRCYLHLVSFCVLRAP
jgi:hypothetical protein